MPEGLILRPATLENDPRLHELEVLREENRKLRDKVATLQDNLDDEKRKNQLVEYAATQMRMQLEPLYNGLQALFGQLEAIPFHAVRNTADGVFVDTADPKRKVWESWLDKFGRDSMASRFITALLDHGQMNVAQLRIAMKCGQQTVYDTATRLKTAGLINRNGGKYSLKEL